MNGGEERKKSVSETSLKELFRSLKRLKNIGCFSIENEDGESQDEDKESEELEQDLVYFGDIPQIREKILEYELGRVAKASVTMNSIKQYSKVKDDIEEDLQERIGLVLGLFKLHQNKSNPQKFDLEALPNFREVLQNALLKLKTTPKKTSLVYLRLENELKLYCCSLYYDETPESENRGECFRDAINRLFNKEITTFKVIVEDPNGLLKAEFDQRVSEAKQVFINFNKGIVDMKRYEVWRKTIDFQKLYFVCHRLMLYIQRELYGEPKLIKDFNTRSNNNNNVQDKNENVEEDDEDEENTALTGANFMDIEFTGDLLKKNVQPTPAKNLKKATKTLKNTVIDPIDDMNYPHLSSHHHHKNVAEEEEEEEEENVEPAEYNFKNKRAKIIDQDEINLDETFTEHLHLPNIKSVVKKKISPLRRQQAKKEYNEEDDDIEDDEIERMMSSENENKKPDNKKKTKGKVPYSKEEIETLKAGVSKYGTGNWALILSENKLVFSKYKQRTTVNLKDLWRNLIKQGVA